MRINWLVPFAITSILWGIVSSVGMFPEELFPSLYDINSNLVDLLLSRSLWFDLAISVVRVTVGFLLASVTAFVIGILMAYYNNINTALFNYNNFIRYLPVAALVPLLMLWLGTGEVQKISVIFIGTFFQLTLMIRDEVKETPRGLIYTANMLGITSNIELITRILIPYKSPELFDIMKVGLGWAWSYLLIAEIIAAQSGIGYKITLCNRYLQTPKIIAYLLILGLIGVFFDRIMEFAHHKLFLWKSETRITRS